MEVFIRGLSKDLTENGLQLQLEPFMNRLGILDFRCDKPKKRDFGFVTFLRQDDGQRFLASYGEQVKVPATSIYRGRLVHPSQLALMGSAVYCKLSNRPAQDYTLKHLQYEFEQRAKPSQERQEAEESSALFSLVALSCGYCKFIDENLVYLPEVSWPEKGTAKFTKKTIFVKLNNKWQMTIPLKTVVDLVWFGDGNLTLTLSTAPLFFSNDTVELSIEDWFMRALTTNSHGQSGNQSQPTRSRVCSFGGGHEKVVGQCLVYQFGVDTNDLYRKIEQLKKLGISITRYSYRTPRVLDTHLDFAAQLKTLKTQLATYHQKSSLPFVILYQLQALADNAYLPPATVTDLAEALCHIFSADTAAGKISISVDAMKKLFDMIDWPFPQGNPMDFTIPSLIAKVKEIEREIQESGAQRAGIFKPTANLARIHRVVVTPTRMTLHGPEMEPKNRILRKYPNHHEHFIRVQLCDENGEDIFFNARVNCDAIYLRFKNILKHGIQVAGRLYSFLGFSHSSLRSHSVWFSSPFVDDNGHLQTYFSIIGALGKFSQITSPARCAARIGQAFSETPFAIPLDENGIVVGDLPDVKSPDSLRIFSDGVGTISYDAMETIRSALPLTKCLSTCFQIRLGAAKGMIAVDSRLVGSSVQLRPSMVKFESNDTQNLEICDMGATHIPMVLNRQIIKILEDMGVSDDWFFRLQNDELARLRGVTANAGNTARFLKAQNIGSSIRLHKLFRHCEHSGVEYRKERFLRSVVEAVLLRELRLLKHKARIPVKKGITLFGIMDETGFLGENQVYVTFEKTKGRDPPPGPTQLLVTRSPALYDGDVQLVFNQVPPRDHPLAAHRNCIVFSQKGSRDLPSQLSGGDLDGDLYNIIWDTDVAPIRVFAPAEYPRVDSVDIKRAVTVDDMAEFFIDFMKTDHLGVIATRHMILADQKEEGTSHPDCKKLAQLHSTAVDFSKTGIPVGLQDLPRTNTYRPDFMAQGLQTRIYDKSEIELEEYIAKAPDEADEEDSVPRRRYYRSERILGKLYRAIDEKKIWYEDVRSQVKPDDNSFWDQFISSCQERCNAFGQIAWHRRVKDAWRIRSTYEDATFSVMNDFSEHPINPISELEVFIGFTISTTGVQTQRQRERSIKLKDEFERIAGWITSQLRQSSSYGMSESSYEAQVDVLELCFACVLIGGGQGQSRATRRHMSGGHSELNSFRVIAACSLLAEIDLFELG